MTQLVLVVYGLTKCISTDMSGHPASYFKLQNPFHTAINHVYQDGVMQF